MLKITKSILILIILAITLNKFAPSEQWAFLVAGVWIVVGVLLSAAAIQKVISKSLVEPNNRQMARWVIGSVANPIGAALICVWGIPDKTYREYLNGV